MAPKPHSCPKGLFSQSSGSLGGELPRGQGALLPIHPLIPWPTPAARKRQKFQCPSRGSKDVGVALGQGEGGYQALFWAQVRRASK